MGKKMSSLSTLRRGLLIFALILSFLGQFALDVTPALACSCAPETPQGYFDYASVVFSGKVIDNDYRSYYLAFDFTNGFHQSLRDPSARFETIRVWKGVVGPSIVITTENSTCGYSFPVGETFLVYAVEETVGLQTVLYTNVCTGTTSFLFATDYLADHLDFLGEGTAPAEGVPIVSAIELEGVIAWVAVAMVGVVIIAVSVIVFKRRRAL